ncbi:MAG TPA: efflux transporter outer membrane subunit [Acetobacteraceae bacterium]|nr:efflux transporter outer membrane subunit [Acetobacteraceae bacterium]
MPIVYKELNGWKPATPMDAIDRGAWWSVYRGPVLDGLERQVVISNQTVREAEAAYRAAAAEVKVARANLFPVLENNGGVTRSSGGGGSVSSSGSGGAVIPSVTIPSGTTSGGSSFGDGSSTSYSAQAIESGAAAGQVSAADLVNAQLSAQVAVATDYFELRGSDALQRLLEQTVTEYERSLRITQNQYNAGTAARSDVIIAQTQLETTRAQAINVGVARAQFEHAIAVLIGRPPAELTLPAASLAEDVPVLPPSLPSTLLERRPDIAAAERAMEDENALIGVQVAAYYPDISLSALYGYVGSPLGSLIQASNRVWSLGAAASETLFEGGARPAAVAAARATYDQSVATYRQTVLIAFQQVEDALSTLRILQQQAVVQDNAVRLARQAVQIALNEYRAGTVAYTTVVTDQATALADEQAALSFQSQRLPASAALIGALGGGWSASELPSKGSFQH